MHVITKKVIFAKLIGLIFLSLYLFIFLFSLDNTPFRIHNQKLNFSLKAYVPQSWGFFTRDPQEEQVIIYEVLGKEKMLKEVIFDMTSKDNYFGLSRKIRKKNYEFSQIILKIPEKQFDTVKGERSLLKVENSKGPYCVKIDKSDFDFIEEGELLIYKYSIIPWEWSKITNIELGRKSYVSIEYK